MSKLKILDIKGSRIGDFEIPDEILEAKRGAQAVHDVIVAHLAACRAGTASTLRKGEVAGSNKKPWRQKGTGRARSGLRQSPVWRGGGVAFGPHPRSYDQKINKKVSRLAFQRAFTDKLIGGDVVFIDEISLDEAKTKKMADMITSLKIGKKVLVVLDKIEDKIAKASRNMADIKVIRASDLDVYNILLFPKVVVSKAGAEIIKQRLASAAGGAE